MKTFLRTAGVLAAAALALAWPSGPAVARDSYVQDGAGLFSAATVSDLNAQIASFNGQTGKEIVIVTVPSFDGTLNDAVERTFAAQQVNGVLFFFAKAEKQDVVVGDRASDAFFLKGTFANIHDAMRGYLRDGDSDQAIKTGVALVLDQYRSHQTSMGSGTQLARVRHFGHYGRTGHSSLGGGMSLFWFILILLAGFLIIRALFRAVAGPRMMPPGYGPGGAPGGPGYGPGYGGYGPGYGYGGGGGGFFSGLLGGLGGAFLGNELFGNRGQTMIDPGTANVAGDPGTAPDGSGWQSDAGQPDMGNMGGGGWGDSGGGFDSGGGGDFGGGGGDSGGGGW